MTRIISFLILVSIGLTVPWPFFFIGAALYAFYFDGIELIVFGFLLDAYARVPLSHLPLASAYTLALTGILLIAWGLKPLIMFDRSSTLQ
jgi:hypothetical protein